MINVYQEEDRADFFATIKKLNKKIHGRKYNKTHKVEIAEYRILHKVDKENYDRQYRKTHRIKIAAQKLAYKKTRRNVDPLYRLNLNIHNLIGITIKNKRFSKKAHTTEILGCSYIEFKLYLESKFTTDMSWDNRNEWHIDHIIPVASAKTEEELIKLNKFSNLQPLWATTKIAIEHGEPATYIGNIEKSDNIYPTN
jgi:hypothetical protein